MRQSIITRPRAERLVYFVVILTMKTCTICDEVKPEAEFYFRNAEAGTLRADCKECLRGRVANWVSKNPGVHAAGVARWRANNQQKDREVRRAAHTRWAKAHPAHMAAKNAARYASKSQATPGWTNHVAVGEFYAFAAIKARLTGKPQHVDHIVPLHSRYVCGLHTHFNLEVLEGVENIKKGNRHWPDMWEPETRSPHG